MAKKVLKPKAKAVAKPKVSSKKPAGKGVVAKKAAPKKPAAKPVAKAAKKVAKPAVKSSTKSKPVAKKVVAAPKKKVVAKKAVPAKKVAPAKKAVAKKVVVKKVEKKVVKKVVAKPVVKKAVKKVEVKKVIKKVEVKSVKKESVKSVSKSAAKKVKDVPAKATGKGSSVIATKAKTTKVELPKKSPGKAAAAVQASSKSLSKKVEEKPKKKVEVPEVKESKAAKSGAAKAKVEVAKEEKPKDKKAKKAEVAPSTDEPEFKLAPEDEAILADAMALGKPKKEPRVKREVVVEGPVDGKPRLFKIGVAQPVLNKPVANPIHVTAELSDKQRIFAPIANPERNEKGHKTEEMISINQLNKSNHEDAKKGISVESKLRGLYALQLIDSRIDKIRATRGELPHEVEDLRDEVAGLESRLARFNNEMNELDGNIQSYKGLIKEAEASIKNYKEQLARVKNNREFDSLNKEIEFQELEIELQKKHIRNAEASKTNKQVEIEATKEKISERQGDLNVKEKELNTLITETQKEEDFLNKYSEQSKKALDAHLMERYSRMRKSAQNGLAVVPIERDASAGSFIQIPAQIQMDVRMRKRIITDEHSGRILVDEEMAREEEEKFAAVLKKELGK